jgi:hypothetical protein
VNGAVWDSDRGNLARFHAPLPTKTSRLVIQSSGRFPCLRSRGSQVFFIRCVCFLSLLILVAMIWSLVSLPLIARSHLPLICWSVGFSFPMTLSHRRTQTKWVVSEMSSCRSRVGLGKITGHMTRAGYGYGSSRVRVRAVNLPPVENPRPRARVDGQARVFFSSSPSLTVLHRHRRHCHHVQTESDSHKSPLGPSMSFSTSQVTSRRPVPRMCSCLIFSSPSSSLSLSD